MPKVDVMLGILKRFDRNNCSTCTYKTDDTRGKNNKNMLYPDMSIHNFKQYFIKTFKF